MKKIDQQLRKEYEDLLGVLQLLDMKPIITAAMRSIRRTMGNVSLDLEDIPRVKNDALSRLKVIQKAVHPCTKNVKPSMKCPACGAVPLASRSSRAKLCRICKVMKSQQKLSGSFIQRRVDAQTNTSIWAKDDLKGKALRGGLPSLGKKQ